MKVLVEFVKATLIGGLLVLLPLGVVVILVVKVVGLAIEVVHPIAARLPIAVNFRDVVALVIILAACFFAGLLARTRTGQTTRAWMDRRVFDNVPGYALVRSVTRQAAGVAQDEAFAPAFAVIEDALVPAFIVEEHPDGACTVFVPAAPTPGVGAVYILPRERVHRVDVPFARMVRSISQWGVGSQALRAAMRPASGGRPS